MSSVSDRHSTHAHRPSRGASLPHVATEPHRHGADRPSLLQRGVGWRLAVVAVLLLGLGGVLHGSLAR